MSTLMNRPAPVSLEVVAGLLLQHHMRMPQSQSLQDVPGWGDDINLVNNLRAVVEFLLRQRQLDYISNRAGRKGKNILPLLDYL